MEIDEAAILERCRKGDCSGFGDLYQKYLKSVYNFVYYRTHHRQTAEDLTGLAFFRALEGIAGFRRERGSFSSWLYQIARNAIIDHYRSHKQTASLEDAWDLPGSASAERDAETAMRLEKVKNFLSRLEQRQRDIVVMRIWDGLSHRQIAEILGMTEASCKMAYSRVMAELGKQELLWLLAVLAGLSGQS